MANDINKGDYIWGWINSLEQYGYGIVLFLHFISKNILSMQINMCKILIMSKYLRGKQVKTNYYLLLFFWRNLNFVFVNDKIRGKN